MSRPESSFQGYNPTQSIDNAKEFVEVNSAGLDSVTAGKCTKCITAPCSPPAPKCAVPCTGKCRRGE